MNQRGCFKTDKNHFIRIRNIFSIPSNLLRLSFLCFLSRVVSGCTYVMHTASPFPLVNPQTADELVVPAVNGTLSVLEACRDAGGVKRVVLTSSIIAICGNSKTDQLKSFLFLFLIILFKSH